MKNKKINIGATKILCTDELRVEINWITLK